MDLARLAHDRPCLTFVTIAGLASAGTLLAMREMGCSRPTGAVGNFVWEHPVLTALGVIAVAAGAEKLQRDGHLAFMTGAVRRPVAHRPSSPQQLPRGAARPQPQRQPQQPAGGAGHHGYGAQQTPEHRQQPAASPLPTVSPAPYASAHATPRQDDGGQQNLPSVQPAQGASAHATPHQDPPPWAADIATHFSWPPQ